MLTSDTPCRVLIVEDDFEIAEVLRRLLSNEERNRRFFFDVKITSSAKDAEKAAVENSADVFVIDLGLEDENQTGRSNSAIGLRLLPRLLKYPNAGIIVYSTEDKRVFYEQVMKIGVDDFIQKTDPSEYVVEKIIAVWRRTISVRNEITHNLSGFGRKFKIGDWDFIVGNQMLLNEFGEKRELGITEHEFLKHLALAADHTIDADALMTFVLRKKRVYDEVDDKALENLIYRLRKKLGTDTIVYAGGGKYKANISIY